MTTPRNEQIKIRLDAISRLRLLFADQDELSDYVGRRVTEKNGLSRVGGQSEFLKRAIYDSLCNYANERANHDFDKFICDYEEASVFYAKHHIQRLFRKDPENKCMLLLDYMHLDNTAPKDPKLLGLFQEIYGEERHRFNVNPQILVLMILNLLPPDFYKSRISSKDINEDFMRLMDFLQQLVQRHSIFERFPALEAMRQRVLKDKVLLSRFWLYDDLCDVLESYYDFINITRRQATNKRVRDMAIFPSLEGCMWQEKEGNVWWEWQQVFNGFFLRKLNLNHKRKTITSERFELIIYDEEDGNFAYICRPKAFLNVLEGKTIQRDDSETMAVEIGGNKEKPDSIEFQQVFGYHWFMLSKLNRTKVPSKKFWDKYADYAVIEQDMDESYQYSVGISAITPDYVAVPDGKDGDYLVPMDLDEGLKMLTIVDPAGFVQFDKSGRCFITFTDLNLHYEVTTDEDCKRYGIIYQNTTV